MRSCRMSGQGLGPSKGLLMGWSAELQADMIKSKMNSSEVDRAIDINSESRVWNSPEYLKFEAINSRIFSTAGKSEQYQK
jgi:hypothetical protein